MWSVSCGTWSNLLSSDYYPFLILHNYRTTTYVPFSDIGVIFEIKHESSMPSNVKVRGAERAATPLAERPTRLTGYATLSSTSSLQYSPNTNASLGWPQYWRNRSIASNSILTLNELVPDVISNSIIFFSPLELREIDLY